jgi:hypothetical protein
MSQPMNRVGVFLVDPAHEEGIRAASTKADELFIDDNGVVGPPIWYIARHHLFEQLIGVATFARISETDGTASVAALAQLLGTEDPTKRRAAAKRKMSEIGDPFLREAIAAALADPAAPAGLWIETENELPAEAVTEPGEAVDPEELARRMDAYVAEADRRWRNS